MGVEMGMQVTIDDDSTYDNICGTKHHDVEEVRCENLGKRCAGRR